jgi:hypothetical protein
MTGKNTLYIYLEKLGKVPTAAACGFCKYHSKFPVNFKESGKEPEAC